MLVLRVKVGASIVRRNAELDSRRSILGDRSGANRRRADGGTYGEVRKSRIMPITIFDSDTIPRDRRAELEAAVVAAGRHLSKLFEGWIVATPDRRKFAVRITSYPVVDISVPFEWNATAAEVTERMRRAMDD
jgi:hypothetical protein